MKKFQKSEKKKRGKPRTQCLHDDIRVGNFNGLNLKGRRSGGKCRRKGIGGRMAGEIHLVEKGIQLQRDRQGGKEV